MNDSGKSTARFLAGVFRWLLVFYSFALLVGIFIYGGIGPASNNTGMGGAIAAGMVSFFLYILCLIFSIPATMWLGRWEKKRAEEAGLPPESVLAGFSWATLAGISAYFVIILALDQLLPGTINPGLFFAVHFAIFFAIGWTILHRPLRPGIPGQISSPRLSNGQAAVLSLVGISLVFNGFQFFYPKLRNFPGGFPDIAVHRFTRLVMPADDQSGEGAYITQTIGSYEEIVAFYEQALTTNGWSIKAKWSYGNWPTKIIASDGKQTLRLTIYGRRVDFQVDQFPCSRVGDSERCY